MRDAKALNFYLCLGNAVRGFGPKQSSLGESEHAASGAEDSSGEDELEERVGDVLERFGHGDLTVREGGRADDSEAGCSQRETDGTRAPFAQRSDTGRSGRGSWCGNRGGSIRKQHQDWRDEGRSSWNRRSSRFRGWRDRRNFVAQPQNDLPRKGAIALPGNNHSWQTETPVRQGREATIPAGDYFFFFSKFCFTRNFTIRVTKASGSGSSNGNCTDPLAPLHADNSFLNIAIAPAPG